MESIGVSSFTLNHNKKSSPARLNMRLPSPKADIKPVADIELVWGYRKARQALRAASSGTLKSDETPAAIDRVAGSER
jgi:hypothetical protein